MTKKHGHLPMDGPIEKTKEAGMSERVEAAAKALAVGAGEAWVFEPPIMDGFMREGSAPEVWKRKATAALAAADAVMFNEAAVERAARAIYATEAFPIYDEDKEEFTGTKPWEWLNEGLWDSYRAKARAVIVALKESGNE